MHFYQLPAGTGYAWERVSKPARNEVVEFITAAPDRFSGRRGPADKEWTMNANFRSAARWMCLPLIAALAGAPSVALPAPSSGEPAAQAAKKPRLDRSGKQRKGEASYYGREFYGKKMANGEPMRPQSNVAASKTLPLGTKAEVTNLETGSSAVVEIKDRGPYVDGRIIDVSPKVAEDLDLKEKGTAPVVVKPIELPPPKGEATARAETGNGGSSAGP
jgi:rare lipoprotein A